VRPRPMGSTLSILSAGPRDFGAHAASVGVEGDWRAGSLLPGSGTAVRRVRGGGGDGGGRWGRVGEGGARGVEEGAKARENWDWGRDARNFVFIFPGN